MSHRCAMLHNHKAQQVQLVLEEPKSKVSKWMEEHCNEEIKFQNLQYSSHQGKFSASVSPSLCVCVL